MPNDKESISTLQYMQKYYQEQYMILQQSIEESYNYINEMKETQLSIKEINKISSKEVLNPIGTNSYITTKTDKINSIIMGVGAGIYVEKDIDEAKGFIEKTITTHNEFIKKLIKNKEDLEHALVDIATNLDKLSTDKDE